MKELLKRNKNLILLPAAVLLGVIGSFFFFQYQLAQERQTAKALVTAKLTQNHYYGVLLSLDDQINQILAYCLNVQNCDQRKAASNVDAINAKRDQVIKQEQVDLANLKTSISK